MHTCLDNRGEDASSVLHLVACLEDPRACAWSSNSCLSLAASRKSLFWRGQPRTRHGKREMKRAHKAKLIKAGHIAILKRFVGP